MEMGRKLPADWSPRGSTVLHPLDRLVVHRVCHPDDDDDAVEPDQQQRWFRLRGATVLSRENQTDVHGFGCVLALYTGPR